MTIKSDYLAARRRSRRANVLYACLQVFYWCAYCSFFSFLIVYLLDHGYSQISIGWVMTLSAAIVTLVPLITGYWADYYIPVRKLVCVCLALAVPAAFLLRLTVLILPLAFLSIAAMGILEKSLVSVIDSWGMKLRSAGVDLNYALMRGFASLAFALAAAGLGRLFDAFGLELMFWTHAFFAICALVSAFLLESVPVLSTGQVDRMSYPRAIRLLSRNRPYLILVLSMALAGWGNISIGTFTPMLLREMNGTNADLGAVMLVMAASEFPAMLLFRSIAERVSARKLVGVGMFFLILRCLTPYFAPTVGWLIASQALQLFSFGLYLPALLYYISEITDHRLQATAITLAFACGDGLASMIGNAVGGVLAQLIGVRPMFLIYALVVTVGFILFVLLGGRPKTPVLTSDTQTESDQPSQ